MIAGSLVECNVSGSSKFLPVASRILGHTRLTVAADA